MFSVTVCSFCGGAGGCSAGDIVGTALSPNGPKGPRESSSGSSRVVCAATRRIGPLDRPAGDLVVDEGVAPDNCAVADLDGVSAYH